MKARIIAVLAALAAMTAVLPSIASAEDGLQGWHGCSIYVESHAIADPEEPWRHIFASSGFICPANEQRYVETAVEIQYADESTGYEWAEKAWSPWVFGELEAEADLNGFINQPTWYRAYAAFWMEGVGFTSIIGTTHHIS